MYVYKVNWNLWILDAFEMNLILQRHNTPPILNDIFYKFSNRRALRNVFLFIYFLYSLLVSSNKVENFVNFRIM